MNDEKLQFEREIIDVLKYRIFDEFHWLSKIAIKLTNDSSGLQRKLHIARKKIQRVKLVVVGDGAVGKSNLLVSYCTNALPSEYVQTVFEKYSAHLMVDGKPFSIEMWDTGGHEEYDRLRPLAYPGTDIVLICFSVDKIVSLENIKQKWVTEITHFLPNTPMILVGCKSDLRGIHPEKCIPMTTIKRLAKKFNLDYYETSALTQKGLTKCIANGIRHALNGIKAKQSKKGGIFTRKTKDDPIPPVMPPIGRTPGIEIETSTFADDWQKMLEEPKFFDVVFLLEDGQEKLEAHKLILCSTSNFFRQILGLPNTTKNQLARIDNSQLRHEDLNSGIEGIAAIYQTENDNKVVTTVEISAGIKAKTFARVLEFLYIGVPKLSELQDVPDAETELLELKRVAKIFKLSSLATICTNIENGAEFLNPSIVTDLNNETGKQMKTMFFNQSSMADVIFRVEDQSIYANKVVLCARCSVMAVMFGGKFLESDQSTLAEVKIPNTSVECFLALLEYMYTDHSPIKENDSVGIMVLADEYGQSRLIDICELYITREVDRSTSKQIKKAEIDVIGLLLTAQMCNADQLSGWCLHFIASNYTLFEKRSKFHQLKGDNKKYIEEHRWPPLSYLEEDSKYKAEMKKRGEKCSVM